MKKYFKIWLFLTSVSSQIALASRFGGSIFFIGKFLRFGLFIFFVLLIQAKTKTIVGYSLWQIIFFFTTFNIIDVVSQFFLREVYIFRRNVISGQFDYSLIKPISPLFQALLGGSDILDLPMLFVSFGLLFFSFTQLGSIAPFDFFLYTLLLVNGLLIALSFHVLVACMGILTTEVDNALWIYRDLTQMGRFPIDIYREPLSFFLTFVMPIGIMITVPGKAIMGLLNFGVIAYSLSFGVILFLSSLWLWKRSLRGYTSASS